MLAHHNYFPRRVLRFRMPPEDIMIKISKDVNNTFLDLHTNSLSRNDDQYRSGGLGKGKYLVEEDPEVQAFW